MNKAVRRIGFVLAMAFVVLFANLNYIQLVRSQELTEHPLNPRDAFRVYGIHRGEILAADNTVLARSEPTTHEVYKFKREYPQGELFGHITGYYTPKAFCGSGGLERSYDDYLLGLAPRSTDTFMDELLGRQPDGNILKLTVEPDLQRLARRALKGQRGGVAAIDPRTGAVLALYSNPAYDPNEITKRAVDDCQKGKLRLERDQRRPMRSRAFSDRYPPGSTFKIVTAAAGLSAGMSPGTTFPDPRRLDLPDTDRSLGNYQGGSCVGGSISMSTAFRVSCNTTFAQIAMRVGAKKFTAMGTRFGINKDPGFEIPEAVASCMRAVPGLGCGDATTLARPFVAYSGIGQNDVRMTPLGMARVAATVANRGRVPNPYVVERILAADGGIIQKTKPSLSKPIYNKRVARQMRQLMTDAVRFGTGRAAGFRHGPLGIIGGKTGTAQTGTGDPPHVWFAAWGPGIAVAVVVENGGDLRDEATGGRVAGPIAAALVNKVVAAELRKDD